MSDQSSGSRGSNAETFEPRMEDILTSIPRIIADDDTHKTDVPELLEGAEPQMDESSVARPVDDQMENLEISDEDTDLMMGDLVIPDDTSVESPETTDVLEPVDLEAPTLSDLGASEFEADTQGKSDSSHTGLNSIEETNADTEMVSEDDLIDINDFAASALEDSVGNDDLVVDPAINLLEDENLLEPSDSAETVDTLELTSDLVANDDITETTDLDELANLSTLEPNLSDESDMDIVKALMADLTDDSFLDDLEADEDAADVEALTETQSVEVGTQDLEQLEDLEHDDSIFELEDIAEEDLPIAEEAEDETEVLDDILNLTLEDEETLQIEQKNALEQLEVETLEADDLSLLKTAGKTAAGAGGLLAIAKMAEADADEAEAQLTQELQDNEIQQNDQQAALKSLLDDITDEVDAEDVAKAEPLSLETLTDETEQESLDIEAQLDELNQLDELEIDLHDGSETEPEDMNEQSIMKDPHLEASEEKETMPRAKKSDAILDEVEKTASADVFASLNKVVEEKAILAERGDRIGDLVMEALRPMLKEWLDENLKGIVERAVTKEVKRISSGK